MNRIVISALWIIFALSTPSIAQTAEKLQLKNAYLVDGIEGLEPSGIDVCGDQLVFVSDKHDNTIFTLTLKYPLAQVSTYLSLEDIPTPPEQAFPLNMKALRFMASKIDHLGGYDWEGLACNDKGELFLASEAHFSVLKIDKERNLSWVVNDLYKHSVEKGLFQVNNAYLEGIGINGEDIVLAAERQPRALITVKPTGEIDIHLDPKEMDPAPKISFDYTGIDHHEGNMYVLDRNRYLVCQRNPPTFTAEHCHSYKHAEHSQKWAYDTGIYGLAEGIAIDGDNLWILLDNNKDFRLDDPTDNRPTLMQFKNPY